MEIRTNTEKKKVGQGKGRGSVNGSIQIIREFWAVLDFFPEENDK